jgi:hypothetical protein
MGVQVPPFAQLRFERLALRLAPLGGSRRAAFPETPSECGRDCWPRRAPGPLVRAELLASARSAAWWYASTVAQRNHVPDVPEALQGLVRQLAELPQGARETVIEAARHAANQPLAKLPTVSWESLRAAKGIVSLGGNALADSEALYDEC